MNKSLTVKKEQDIKIMQGSAEALISQAIDKGVTVDTMEKLLTMRRELKAEWAKEQFDKAMAKFQSECPIIEKTKIVYNKDKTVRYKFAPIESIIAQVKDLLKVNGFSYAINSHLNSGITITCRVIHEAGHSESSEFSVPIDKDAYMNEQQKVASASTFAKRYAFLNAFGILTGDEDTDTAEVEIKQPKTIVKEAMLTDFQRKKIFALTTQKGKTNEELHAYIEKVFKVKSVNDLTVSMANKTIEKLESMPDGEKPIDLDEADREISQSIKTRSNLAN